MAEIAELEFERRSDQLLIHFGVEGHFLKLETFVRTADSARRVIEALDATFFQESLEYEIIVLPPESGTFLQKLALWVGGVPAVFFTFVNSDVGSAYIEGLTGRPSWYWARQAGETTHDIIENLSQSGEDEAAEMVCHTSAQIITAMARGVLEKDADSLSKIGMELGALPVALEARADFYLACLQDSEVKEIGFTSDDIFPIPRSSFPERARKPDRREDEEDHPPWHVSIESLYVTSPNWDYEDQKSRQWKGKDESRRDCYFIIEDAEFWSLAKRKDLRVEVLDNLKVQWAFQMIEGRPKNRRVLRVIEFNGEKLAEPLAADAIGAILGEYASVGSLHDGEPSLFD